MSCEAPPSTEDLMPRKARYDRSQQCIKCKSARGNLVIKHAVYCSSCLTPMLIRKFRRALSASLDPAAPQRGTPSRTTPPDVVLALSGGPASTVLLDLVWKCFSTVGSGRKDERRQIGRVRAVHVDWSALSGRSAVQGVKELCEKYDVELTVVTGESAFDPAWFAQIGASPPSIDLSSLHINPSSPRLPFLPPTSPSTTSHSPLTLLHTHLSSLPTPSAAPAALHTLTRLLLVHTAASLGAHVLMLGTSLPRLSVRLLEAVVYGGGFALGNEREEVVSLSLRPSLDTETGAKEREVKLVRPLRDWSLKELGWWVRSRGLSVARGIDGKPSLSLSPGNAGKTLSKLTEDFVLGLERDYPSTVSTISRTSAKVAPVERAAFGCVYCGRPAQGGATRWKERGAIMAFPAPVDVASEPLTPPKTPPVDTEVQGRDMADQLCYACFTHFTARGGTGAGKMRAFPSSGGGGNDGEREVEGMPMPIWVRRRVGEDELRESMSELLLDEQ